MGLCTPGKSTCAARKRGGVCPAEGELQGSGALAQTPNTGSSFGISTCETVPPVGSLQVTAVLHNVREASGPSHCSRSLPVLSRVLCFPSGQFPSILERPRSSLFIFAWPTPSSPTSYYRQYDRSDPSERSRFEGFSSLFANLWPLNKAGAVLLTWVL